MENNEAYLDSSIIYMQENAEQYHLVDGSAPQVYGKDNTLRSYFEYSTVERNEVVEGGRLITVADSAIEITQVRFAKNNFIYNETTGIYASNADVRVLDCVFNGLQRQDFFTRLYNSKLNEINGAFIAVYAYSTLTVVNSSFKGGRSTLGGCILTMGPTTTFIENSSFSLCAA